MKIKVNYIIVNAADENSYNDDSETDYRELVSEKDYDLGGIDLSDEVVEAIEVVERDLGDNFPTIDHGGSEETVEFDFPDVFFVAETDKAVAYASKLMRDLEGAFAPFQRKA
jgi:hypothetical protein